MVTLAEAKLNVQDDLQMGIIDEFGKNNFIMNNIPWDDVVSPTGGGATMTYAYNRLITQPKAEFRAINTEYVDHEVTRERKTVDIKVFGGSYSIDRVIADMGGIVSEVQLQASQKVKAASALFNDTVINGDSAVDANSFDGLEVALTGSSTELVPTMAIDLSSSAAIDNNYKVFLDILDEFLMGLDGTPSMIAGNTKLIAKLRACARRAAMYQTTLDAWGRQVEQYNGIPLIDLGAKAGTNDPIVSTDASGETSLYAVRFGMDGFHAVTTPGQFMRIWLPDYTTSRAVKTGEVEALAAVVLKATKAAAVLRRIKVS